MPLFFSFLGAFSPIIDFLCFISYMESFSKARFILEILSIFQSDFKLFDIISSISEILFEIPFLPKIEIHAYVRSNILIHIGMMNNKSNVD